MVFFFFFCFLRLRRRTRPPERRRRLTRPLLSTVLVPPARADVVRALAWCSVPVSFLKFHDRDFCSAAKQGGVKPGKKTRAKKDRTKIGENC